MSALQPFGALISIGGAILYTIGLNPQRLSTSAESRVPGHPVPAGMDYQLTGMGERMTTIEARTHPQVTGGLDSLSLLKAHLQLQRAVPLIRLHGNYLGFSAGLVIVQTLDVDEEKLHPRDGVGRVVDVVVGLIHLPVRGGIVGSFFG